MRFGPLANESEDYRKIRDELFDAEIALRDQRERVAPCTMCTMWVDGFNGIGHHLRQRLNFAIIAQAGICELRQFARTRDWRKLGLISAVGTDFKTDLQFSDAAGNQWPGVSAFTRSADGSVKHFYSGSAIMENGTRHRGIDLLTPFWNILDLTPAGRGEWMPKLEYGLANVQKH
jgi:predicted dithiol-disulfide oxidoreductase (DUF899 family)